MKPKSLFNIILKIFGLFFARDFIYRIPQVITSLSFLSQPGGFNTNSDGNSVFLAVAFTVFFIAFYTLIIFILIFKTNGLIRVLRLEKGFDETEFSIKFSTTYLLHTSLIIIGGIILVDEIPNLISNIVNYFQIRSLTHGMTIPDRSYIVTSAIEVIIGLLLIGERRRIKKFIEQNQIAKVNESPEDNSMDF